jgi:hypothetical protein
MSNKLYRTNGLARLVARLLLWAIRCDVVATLLEVGIHAIQSIKTVRNMHLSQAHITSTATTSTLTLQAFKGKLFML